LNDVHVAEVKVRRKPVLSHGVSPHESSSGLGNPLASPTH
jgi:hypothetical protein